jgi:hypothetical protein
MAIRLILVCKEGPARNAYLREAISLGIDVDAVSSFAEMKNLMLKTPYQGILTDCPTTLKINREEHVISQEILGVFPLMQLTWDSKQNKIRSLHSDTSSSGTMAHFIAYECQPFTPRTIRADSRKCVNLNAEIYRDQDSTSSSVERSVTVNLSKSGCFLCSFTNWSGIEKIQFMFKELEEKTPLEANIIWRQPWGKSMTFPGLGLRFTKISSKQLNELIEKFRL